MNSKIMINPIIRVFRDNFSRYYSRYFKMALPGRDIDPTLNVFPFTYSRCEVYLIGQACIPVMRGTPWITKGNVHGCRIIDIPRYTIHTITLYFELYIPSA